jgi:beta-lactam-binding protein with PASTA domain
MGFISAGASAIAKLAGLAVLLLAFLGAMAGVVYMSLSGTEVKVPEIVGKDFVESEKELAALGLKIKRRADRASTEKMNTVLEQLPKPGETVKTGQLILVVVSKAGQVADETPKSLQKDIEADDTKKIEEMISDKPKRVRTSSNSNANAKKTADTTRDTIANTPLTTDGDAAKGDPSGESSNKKDPGAGTGDKGKSNSSTGPTMRPQPSPKPPASRP